MPLQIHESVPKRGSILGLLKGDERCESPEEPEEPGQDVVLVIDLTGIMPLPCCYEQEYSKIVKHSHSPNIPDFNL